MKSKTVKSNYVKAKGFTLIELIVVIVILGIMAAVAVPRFVDLQSDARVSVMEGLEGAIRGSSTLVYSKSLIDGTEAVASSSVALDATTTVNTVFGYPAATAAGIHAALDLQTADIDVSTPGTFSYVGRSNCSIVYAAAASAGATPTITVTTSGC